MNITSQQLKQAIQPAFESSIQKSKSNSKSFEQPTPRIFHSCVCHRAHILIYGGLSFKNSQQFQNEHLFVYRYEIHRFQWKKIQTNFPATLGPVNPLQNIYSHSCVVYGNVMYLFGGKSGKNGPCHNQLWAMNLESFNWRKQDQKGIIPARRQSASFVLSNRTNLFLYGGKNEDHVFNDVHIYRIQSKQWYSVETNNSEFLMSKRLRPGICVVNDLIYVFGGEREISVEENTQNLNDFYQIKIVQKATSVKPDIWVKKISTLLCPGNIVGGKLFCVNQRFVGLLGTNNDKDGSKNKLWLYDPQRVRWIFSKIEDPNKCSIGLAFNALFQYDRVYISGGLTQELSPCASLSSIYIEINQIPTRQYKPIQNGRLCLLCQEQKNSLCRKKINGFKYFEQSLNEIKFPFNAFGLIVDSSNLLKSTIINVNYSCVGKEKYLMIEDDGSCENLWSNEEEFLEDMVKFRTLAEQEMQIQDQALDIQQEITEQNMDIEESPKQRPIANSINKDQILMGSAKKEQDKEAERKLKKKKQQAKRTKARQIRKRKQFSINLKLGSMRLAKKMLYITRTRDGGKRVFFLQQVKIVSIDEQQQQDEQEGQVRYQCHYYFMSSPTSTSNSSCHSSSELSKIFIENEYKNFLKIINDETTMKNHLILIGLRDSLTEDGINEPELKINTKMNDIYFGSNKLLAKAQALNISLPECIDVSLKCYLSLLYLKGEYAKINISTQADSVQEVSYLMYFDKIDNLVKSNAIMDLEAAFDLEQCKIVQIYYNKNLMESAKKMSKKEKAYNSLSRENSSSNQLGIFLNGILIYHRNRLIKRYEYPLGSLLKYNDLRKIVTKNYNPIKMFGFIQLDEVFYTNILKSNLVNDQNLCNMYDRIKFVNKFLQAKNIENLNMPATKRSSRKLQSEGEQQFETKKKIKID